MRFLIDEQLPPALADRLKQAGHQAEHTNTIGFEGATDKRIWAHAVSRGAVIITKDEDFADLARRSRDGPSVVWIRLGNTTTQALWSAPARLMPEILDGLLRGERLIEII
jgi:predicted nuclease of predicted toxin-antitoxin system